MSVRVRMFAALKDYFADEFPAELQDGENLRDLRHRLIAGKPEAKELLESCRFAAGNRFVEETHIPKEGEEISFLPPSSGG